MLTRRSHRGGWAAAAADLVAVVVFAAIGRHSHDESDGLSGILVTAWPFVAGLAVGWLAVLLVRRRAPLGVRAAVPVWWATVAVGMVLRHLAGRGTPVAFIAVASVFLGLFLLGWRAIAQVSARRDR